MDYNIDNLISVIYELKSKSSLVESAWESVIKSKVKLRGWF